jgi:hypothetical protein
MSPCCKFEIVDEIAIRKEGSVQRQSPVEYFFLFIGEAEVVETGVENASSVDEEERSGRPAHDKVNHLEEDLREERVLR